jgi:hypothetical protein
MNVRTTRRQPIAVLYSTVRPRELETCRYGNLVLQLPPSKQMSSEPHAKGDEARYQIMDINKEGLAPT